MKKLIILAALLFIGCASTARLHQVELCYMRTLRTLEYYERITGYMDQARDSLITPDEAVAAMGSAHILWRMQCRADSMQIYHR